MKNAAARIKNVRWGGLWLLILTGLSIKLYLTFIQLSANFSRIEKYTLAHRILHTAVSNVSTEEPVAESLTTWITKYTPYGFPAEVTTLEIIDSVPKEKEIILLYDFDLAGRCTFSFLRFEEGDSSNLFFNKMDFLNYVRESDLDFLALPYLGNDYLCRATLEIQETKEEYYFVIASARRDTLRKPSNPSRYIYFYDERFYDEGVVPYAAEELPAAIFHIAEQFNVSAAEPNEVYKQVRTRWKNQSISIPVLNLDVPAPIAHFLLFILAFSYLLLLSSNLRRLAEMEIIDREEPWIAIEHPAPKAFTIGTVSYRIESILSKAFYFSVVLSTLLIGILCILMWLKSGYNWLLTLGLFSLAAISLIPTISCLSYLSTIFKKSTIS